MYVPDHHRIDDVGEMHALMRARSFAALISTGPLALIAPSADRAQDEGQHGALDFSPAPTCSGRS